MVYLKALGLEEPELVDRAGEDECMVLVDKTVPLS